MYAQTSKETSLSVSPQLVTQVEARGIIKELPPTPSQQTNIDFSVIKREVESYLNNQNFFKNLSNLERKNNIKSGVIRNVNLRQYNTIPELDNAIKQAYKNELQAFVAPYKDVRLEVTKKQSVPSNLKSGISTDDMAKERMYQESSPFQQGLVRGGLTKRRKNRNKLTRKKNKKIRGRKTRHQCKKVRYTRHKK